MNEQQDQNPDNWKYGIFYFNQNDKRLFVPKRNPAFGITVNFANPYSYLLFVLLIIMLVCLVKFT